MAFDCQMMKYCKRCLNLKCLLLHDFPSSPSSEVNRKTENIVDGKCRALHQSTAFGKIIDEHIKYLVEDDRCLDEACNLRKVRELNKMDTGQLHQPVVAAMWGRRCHAFQHAFHSLAHREPS